MGVDLQLCQAGVPRVCRSEGVEFRVQETDVLGGGGASSRNLQGKEERLRLGTVTECQSLFLNLRNRLFKELLPRVPLQKVAAGT